MPRHYVAAFLRLVNRFRVPFVLGVEAIDLDRELQFRKQAREIFCLVVRVQAVGLGKTQTTVSPIISSCRPMTAFGRSHAAR